MKATVQLLVVDMDMASKPGKQVYSWEVPVLQEKYGEGKVLLHEATQVDVKALPDARDEMNRLRACHGVDTGDGGRNVPFVELAYGHGTAGVKALEKAIKASASKPRKKAAPKPKPAPEGDGDGGEVDPVA